MPNYTYRAEWSDDYCQYLGLCLEFKGRYATALTPHEAIERVEKLIALELHELAEIGKFAVRTSPVLHERLVVEAAEQGISLNQWVSYKLAGRPAPSIDDLFG